jgi:hypothetical protein
MHSTTTNQPTNPGKKSKRIVDSPTKHFGFGSWLVLGTILGLSRVGTTCIQHFTLRCILYRSNYIPWNYARFLDYCTERLLLQRVGGRYRFIHRLLQEHFAAMPLEK